MCGESRTHGVERGKRWKAVLTHRSDLTYRYHDEENRPTLMTFGDNQTVTYTYDGLGRVSERSANAGGTAVTTAYTYLDGAYGSNSTTPLVRTMTQAGTELTYTYDETGNITGISDGQQEITYVYDLLGQLIRVNDPYDTTAGTAGTTWVFAYDHGGNIQQKTAYAYTTGSVGAAVQCDTFAYTDANWKDKLTALNGVNITYDEIGNPLSDGTWQYKWAQGRQIRGMQKSGEEVAFAYNADGLRVQKTATSTGTTKYIMHGRNLVHLIRGDETCISSMMRRTSLQLRFTTALRMHTCITSRMMLSAWLTAKGSWW